MPYFLSIAWISIHIGVFGVQRELNAIPIAYGCITCKWISWYGMKLTLHTKHTNFAAFLE
jgi:hypothetical protein